jgi:hypothetical protein
MNPHNRPAQTTTRTVDPHKQLAASLSNPLHNGVSRLSTRISFGIIDDTSSDATQIRTYNTFLYYSTQFQAARFLERCYKEGWVED